MPLFPYNRDIPDAPNDPSADQPLMKANTNNIDNIIDEDHFSFDENNGGLHRQVRMPLRGGSPGTIPPGLIAGEGTLYTKTVTSTGVLTETGLFYTPDNSSDEYQITRTITADFAEFGTSTNYQAAAPPNAAVSGGWTFLPGGLLLQYGTATAANLSTSNVIVFPVTFSNAATIHITLGAIRSNTNDKTISISNGTITTTQFQVILSGSSLPNGVSWMAIGT